MSSPMSATPAMDKYTVLSQTQVFGCLSEEVRRNLAVLAVAKRLQRGEILCSEGAEVGAVYVVASGTVRCVKQSREGKEQVLSSEGPGAVLGVVSIFDGRGFYSTAIAETAVDMLSLDKRQMFELCRRYPELLWNITQTLAQKVRTSAELIEDLSLRHVDQRLAQYLLAMCEPRSAKAEQDRVVEITITRSEIANRLGSTREVISRAFTSLELAGLIRLQGRRLVAIPHLDALRSFAGSIDEKLDNGAVPEMYSQPDLAANNGAADAHGVNGKGPERSHAGP